MKMTGGSVKSEIALLRHSKSKIIRDSFDFGCKEGMLWAFWFTRTKVEVIKIANVAAYSGKGKDVVAYKIGMLVGYLDEAAERRGIPESDALTLDDLRILGLKMSQ